MPVPYTVLIVDDEELARVNLAMALKEHPQWQVKFSAASAAQAQQILNEHTIDLVFLDIQMPEETGLELAQRLSQQVSPPLLVFVTAFNQYAVEAFDVHALDYLLKPFDDARLVQTLARAAQLIEQKAQAEYATAVRHYLQDSAQQKTTGSAQYLTQLSVRSIGKIESIQLNDVLWISAAGNYVELHLAQRTVLHRVPISQLEHRLDPAQFLRVHRSAMVARSHCAKLTVIGDGSYQLTLSNDDHAPVSERYVEQLRQSMATQ